MTTGTKAHEQIERYMSAQTDHDAAAVAALQAPAAGVALWRCDLGVRARDVPRLTASLSHSELERAGRFGTEQLRSRWIAGRATLRERLAAILNVSPADVPLRRGRRGRPEVAIDGAPDFNVSHTGEMMLIAIGVGLASGIRIGVDVERADRAVGAERLARRLLTPRERAALDALNPDVRTARFLRTWTYKEAASKATADGLIAPFRAIDIDVATPRVAAGLAPYDPPHWRLFAIDVGAPYLGALALWRTDAAFD
jgi:4'-phosphopantetheinyl transferase